MKLIILFSLGIAILGCGSAPKQNAKYPNSDDCVRIYWKMIGIQVRNDLIHSHHYEDSTVNSMIADINTGLVETGSAANIIMQCMQMNTQQVNCMHRANTFEAISVCEHQYESSGYK